MPRRQRGKKAKESVEILSDALDSVVSQPFASPEPELKPSASTSSRKPKKSKKYSPSSITSYAELISAIAAGEPHLILGDNIIVEENILIKQNLIIDFNGFSIIAEDNLPSARILDIRSGEVTLAGKGKIFAMGPNGVAIRAFGAISSGLPEYTVVHVGPDIQLFAPNAYGILISPNLGVAYGLTVNFAGRIFARDGICIANGVNGRDLHLPLINLKPGSSIVADEASGAAIEAAGYGIWHITDARLSGAVGANLKSGQLDFARPQIIANAGPAINLLENSAKDLEVTIEQGNYVSMTSDLVMGTPAPVKKFTVKSCEFYGTQDILSPELAGHIKTKSSHLHTDIASFLETLIPQTDLLVIEPAPSPDETILSDEDTITIEDDFMPESSSVPEPPELLADLEITAAPELLSELKIDHPKKSPILEPTEPTSLPSAVDQILDDFSPSDSVDDDLLLQEFADAKITTSVPTDEPTPRPVAIIATPQTVSHSTTVATPQPAPQSYKSTLPLPTLGKPAQPALLSEQEAARNALTDAITEIRRLKPEDYEVGFADLERALRKAEHILASPLADMADIRDASSMLLQAFDNLEERDEFSLSDEELDELFYHGAVLEEVARPSKSSKSQRPASKSYPQTPKSAPTVLEPLATSPDANSAEPDFSVLSEIITTIAGLKLDNYTPESQESLLDELDRAEAVLANMSSSQSEIDEIATSLLAEMSNLQRTRFSHSSAPDLVRTNSPAPVVGALLPATMIDELAPATTWMLGTTMIDEMNPYSMDITTREQILRAMRPWVHEIIEMATEPFKKLSHSIAIGIRAGRHAYRESLHSGIRF